MEGGLLWPLQAIDPPACGQRSADPVAPDFRGAAARPSSPRRGSPVVRSIQPGGPGGSQPHAGCAEADLQSCHRVRACRHQSGPRRAPEPASKSDPFSLAAGDRPSARGSGRASRPGLGRATGRDHSPAPANWLPEGRDRAPALVGSKRGVPAPHGQQDGIADRGAERAGARRSRSSTPDGQRVRVPLIVRFVAEPLRRAVPVAESAPRSRHRGRAPARPPTHLRQPRRDAVCAATGGLASPRPCAAPDDAPLRPRQRPGDRGCG